jgi:hypothetical protein
MAGRLARLTQISAPRERLNPALMELFEPKKHETRQILRALPGDWIRRRDLLCADQLTAAAAVARHTAAVDETVRLSRLPSCSLSNGDVPLSVEILEAVVAH